MGIMQCSTHVDLHRGCQYEEAIGQKGVFRVAGHHNAAALWYCRVQCACHIALCDGRRCPQVWSAWGEFGLRTSCPEWTEDTRGVPWCHRGMPVTRTILQCNHSQSGGIHEFIPAQGIRKQTTSVHYFSTFLEVNLFLWNQKYFDTLFGLLNT